MPLILLIPPQTASKLDHNSSQNQNAASDKRKKQNVDSAFASPTHFQATFGGGAVSSTTAAINYDSAFGGSSAEPTPTHAPSAVTTKSTLDFEGDPFKDADVRYGDPFELAGADPFVGKADPFTAPVDDAFGDPFSKATPSSSSSTTTTARLSRAAPSGPPSLGDPFSLTLKSSLAASKASDPFASPSKNDPFAAVSSNSSAFPASKAGSDLFGSDPFTPSAPVGGQTQDDWFNSSGAFQTPKVDGVSR